MVSALSQTDEFEHITDYIHWRRRHPY